MTESKPGVTPAALNFVTENEARAELAKTGIKMSRNTFINAVEAGKLPKPIRISPKRPVWRFADIQSAVAAL